MAQAPPKFKPSRLIRPTLDTPFHIDYEWWSREDRELRVYLRSHLCPEHRAVFEEHLDTEEIDWIDEDTAEVTRVDGLQHVLRIHCSLQSGYIESHTPLVDAIFRIFLASNNKPLTPVELGARIKRDPTVILKTLSGLRVFKGLRPFTGD
jgi:hypothetical protein